MLTADQLEKIIELEGNLKAQYQSQLDTKTAEIESALKKVAELQATITTQLQTITDMSGKASVSQKIDQQNRELHNRSENMKDEVGTLRQRIKSLQSDLAKEREQVAELKKYDPIKMKKNLDDNKKRLAEKTGAAEMLQKSLGKTKTENAELLKKVAELEARIAELEPAVDAEVGAQEESEAA
jgi:chromosome segregation ATPase